MKKKSPLDGLVIRTALVRIKNIGYIICGDIKEEKNDISHAITFRWNAGTFNKGDRNYNAHTACVFTDPEPGFLDASEQGYYSITTPNGMTSNDIFDTSQPPPSKPRLGGIRSLAEIGGKAYAVGLRGMVYRHDKLAQWTRIDDGLPETFNIQAIHGFGESEIYAVGRKGELWQFDGSIWAKRDVPTNINLTNVKCAGDEKVYICGHKGMLISGRGDIWEIIEHGETTDDIWDLEWFEGKVYISTMRAVYALNDKEIIRVDFGNDAPRSCYQLSVAPGVMWSNGEFDIMSFDGNDWTRVV